MATIKLHIYHGEDDGTISCDYRGQGELTGTHRTIAEREFGPDVSSNDEIQAVIDYGPDVNRILKSLQVDGMGLRIGVFDH